MMIQEQRTLVIGDIHGAHDALLQCFDRSGFSFEHDRLICLGDVADRRAGVKACVDELLKVKHLVYVLGNHDLWMVEWMKNTNVSERSHLKNKREAPEKARGGIGSGVPGVWKYQGGDVTMKSYRDGVPDAHVEFFSKAVYYLEERGRLFVHGGINDRVPFDHQDPDDFLWDRALVFRAIEERASGRKFTEYDEIFVGHTPTLNFSQEESGAARSDVPIHACNIWLMDTGAGWSGGRLTIMDVETKEYWQSDRLG